MRWWYGALGLLAVAAVAAPVMVAVYKPGPAPETNDILTVGQTYVFTTGDATFIGEVLEMPRDHWVKVRLLNNTGTPAKATWVNLQRVKAVSLVDPKDVKSEPRP
jgi:hypothetical protein